MGLVSSNALRDASHGVGVFGASSADPNTLIQGQFDPSTKRFLVDATTTPAAFTAFAGATATIVTSGTAVQLATHSCSQLIITSNASNLGTVYLGGSDVLASSKNGIELEPTGSVVLSLSNTNLVWADSTHSGDTLSYVYLS